MADNGGGKTAILDGIAIGLSSLLNDLSTAQQKLAGPKLGELDFRLPTLPSARRPTKTQTANFAYVQAETLVTGHPNFQLFAAKTAFNSSETAKRVKTEVVQSDKASKDYAKALLEDASGPLCRLWPAFAYYGARRGWIVVPERLRRTEQSYDHPAHALVGALDALGDFGEMLKWFDAEESSELRALRESETDGRDRFIPLEAVRQAIVPLLGGAYSNPRFNSRHKFVVDSNSSGQELQVSQLSQGYQSMLALGMDFARRLALANRHLFGSAGPGGGGGRWGAACIPHPRPGHHAGG